MDKNKVIQVATKYVQKSQYDRAIAEYGKILRADPKDVRVLLKVGELQQKKGDAATAAKTLLQVAETYSADGFFLKAVAVYKQVLKLDPSLVEVHLQLAELYQQLGLMQDALGQYGLVAANHEKNGNLVAAIDAIRRIVDLAPDNLAARVNLAELFAKENRSAEAVQEFRRAAEALKAQGRVEDFLRVGERIVFLDSHDVGLSRELANLYLARGDSKRALARLQVCFGVDPRHVETLELLGRTFLDLGQTGKAAAVLKELAKVHADESRSDDARAVWRKVLRIVPDDVDARAALEAPSVEPAAAPPPPPPPAAAAAKGPVPLARIALQPGGGPRPPGAMSPSAGPRAAGTIPSVPAPPPNETPAEAIARLIAETDVYVKYGLRDKAFDHLRQVLAIDPDCIEAHERASGLFAAGGNQAAAWGELANVCRICADRGLLERGRPHYERLREEAPHLPELAALSDAYVLAMSNGPVPEPSFVVPLETATDISHEIRLEPADAPEPVADPLVPEVRAPASSDDEALAAAMVSAGAEQIDESAAVVLPDEDAFGAGPLSDDDFQSGQGAFGAAEGSDDALVAGDDEWFFSGDGRDRGAASGEPDSFTSFDGAGAHGDASGPVIAGVLPEDAGDDPLGLGAGPVGLDELETLPAAPDLDGGEAIDLDRPTPASVPGPANATAVGPAVKPAPAARRAPVAERFEPAGDDGLPEGDEALFFRRAADDEILELSDDAILEVGDEDVEPLSSSGETAEATDLANLDGPDPLVGDHARWPGPTLAEPPSGIETTGPRPALEEDAGEPLPDLASSGPLPDLDATGRIVTRAAPEDEAFESLPEDDGPPDLAPAPLADQDGFAAPAAGPEPAHAAASSLETLHLDPEELADMETELDEASFFLAQGLLAEAEDICRSILFRAPSHPSALDLIADIAARREAAASGPGDGTVDLAAELAFDDEAGARGAPPSGEFQYAVEDVFAAFKQGLSRTLEPEDSQTHYDLGIAYQEMGLLADAIEQFTTARAGFRGEPREVDCLSMIARCQSAQGEHREAIARLEEALELPAVQQATRQALLFELGASHEARGDPAGALACYAEVERMDPGFRGVGRIVASLRGRTRTVRKNPAG